MNKAIVCKNFTDIMHNTIFLRYDFRDHYRQYVTLGGRESDHKYYLYIYFFFISSYFIFYKLAILKINYFGFFIVFRS